MKLFWWVVQILVISVGLAIGSILAGVLAYAAYYGFTFVQNLVG